MNPQIVTSPHVCVYINGQLLGTVTSFSYQVVRSADRRPQLDTLEPADLIPTIYKVTGSIGLVKNRGSNLVEARITAKAADMLRFKFITIQLYDRVTEKVIFTGYNAIVTDEQWGVQTKGVMSGSFSFEAMAHEG